MHGVLVKDIHAWSLGGGCPCMESWWRMSMHGVLWRMSMHGVLVKDVHA